MSTLFIVEDNIHMANILASFLCEEGQFSVSGTASSAEEALKSLSHVAVDLVLIDVGLPGMNGIELVKILHDQKLEAPCLMLSGHERIEFVKRALEAGAKGYVLKTDTLAILRAVQQVLAGEIYISDELKKRISF
jgi:DNA-binding NarL/FixJ family response regulator